ncbi:MAG: hypothetical protein JOZ24_10275 [Candidatus Eremiobacteraeota bacterium]|nr:hypothetical protein [Candidatus Eremiobacteraeota bacterium]
MLLAVTGGLPSPRLDAMHVLGAIATMIPIAFAFRELYRCACDIDELERRIVIEAVVVTLLLAIALVLGIGLLQFIAAVPAFNVFWLWVPICFCFAFAKFWAQRRYR